MTGSVRAKRAATEMPCAVISPASSWAAERGPVTMASPDPDESAAQKDPTDTDHRTGEGQAAENDDRELAG